MIEGRAEERGRDEGERHADEKRHVPQIDESEGEEAADHHQFALREIEKPSATSA
jgi:hypothetical protein